VSYQAFYSAPSDTRGRSALQLPELDRYGMHSAYEPQQRWHSLTAWQRMLRDPSWQGARTGACGARGVNCCLAKHDC
jgi:hypothetical protein